MEWKCKVKGKAREIKVDQKRTGGGDRTAKQLTDLELRLMGIIGWVNIDGNNHLTEFGLPSTSPPRMNIGELNNVVSASPQLQDYVEEKDGYIANVRKIRRGFFF